MEFYTANEVYATGVTFDQNYKKRIDYIFLVPLPGFTGPEVVFRKLLPKGQKLRILGILSSSYNIFFKQYFLKVKVVNTNIYDKYTVIIDVDDTFVELAK